MFRIMASIERDQVDNPRLNTFGHAFAGGVQNTVNPQYIRKHQLIVYEDQTLEHIWGMELDDDYVQIAFDCGDNGSIRLTKQQARDLQDVLVALLRDADDDGETVLV